MANANNFIKGAKQVPFRVGAETMQSFPVKDWLTASLSKIGASFPTGFAKGNEPK